MKTILSKFKAKDHDASERLRLTLLKHKFSSRHESGCIQFDLFQSEENSGWFYTRETWLTPMHFELHLTQLVKEGYMNDLQELLDHPFTVVHVKSLPEN